MIDGQPVIYFCMPCGSTMAHYGAVRGQYCATTGQGKYRVLPDQNGHSALTYNFNTLYSRALNARSQVPGGIDYFAMIHSDILPCAGSLEILIDELRLLGCDMLSTVMPLKGSQGWTSTGIDTSTGIRRLTMHEVMRLPESFGREELTQFGFPAGSLLQNTGLWVMDFKRPWVDDLNLLYKAFWVEGGIRLDKDGTYQPWFESEDWNWSRDLQKMFGAKLYATRKARAVHQGDAQWNNWEAWGSDLIDSAWRPAPKANGQVAESPAVVGADE